jgi:chromate transporter
LKHEGSPAGVLWAFLLLGLSSFGGPVAHLGYFRRTFVHRRNWLTEADYASLVSLCQALPGPASSQVGFCLGMKRAGWPGALAAWIGFTLPSALLMTAAATWSQSFDQVPVMQRLLHGMQLAAVAVVAQAVWAMAKNLCPDTPRRMLAVLAAAILILVPGAGGQLLVLAIGALIGWFLPHEEFLSRPADETRRRSHLPALTCIALFATLLVLSFYDWPPGGIALFAAFYRSGALVFGGGHVVLPLLQSIVVAPGYVAPSLFLAGYGAAQAMPGPLFTVAAYLGAVASIGPGGAHGAAIALAGIFLPGLLLAAGVLPYWTRLRQNRAFAGCINGVNAVVVGILAYALLNLITLGSLRGFADLGIAGVAIVALVMTSLPPIFAVAFCAAASIAL